MWALISRWRKKPTTIEVLEKLDKNISAIEKLRRSTLETERRLTGSLLLYSVLLYIIATPVFYFYYLPESWLQHFLYSLPLLVFPLLIWGLKRFLNWYFIQRVSRNETTLENLREEKQTILDEVMERETYKKAKEILERFDTSQKKVEGFEPVTPVQLKSPDRQGQEIRQRGKNSPTTTLVPAPASLSNTPVNPKGQCLTPGQPEAQRGPGLTPGTAAHPGTAARPGPSHQNGQQAQQWAEPSATPSVGKIPHRRTSNPFGSPMRPPGPPMPRAILPRERSAPERILEYLIGDGPQNRYALICRECHSHNGMAFKEEYDFLSFRCCYCYSFNPARRQRPNAPKLLTPLMTRREERKEDVEMESESEEEVAKSRSTTNSDTDSKKDK